MNFNAIPSSEVKYTGVDIPALSIKNGDGLNDVISKVSTVVDAFTSANIANLDCLYGDCGSAEVPLPEAVQKLYDAVCNMNGSKVKTNANLFRLGNNAPSEINTVIDRTFTWNTAVTPSGTNFTYNFSNFVTNLPVGVSLVSITGVVKSSGQNVSNVSGVSGGVTIPNNRVPASVDFKAVLRTGGGTVDFTGTVALPSATNQTNIGAEVFPSRIGSHPLGTSLTQDQFNEVLSSTMSNQQQRLDSLMSFNSVQTQNIQFPGRDITSVVATLTAKLDEALTRIQELENPPLI